MPRFPLRSILTRSGAALVTAALLGACAATFQPRAFPTSPALYQASMAQLAQRKWDNAILGLEKLAADLPARDSLVPRVHFALGQAHAGRREHLLAAQAYSRVVESFPADTLADDALYAAARSYQKLWRKPVLDAEYGHTALATYRSMLDGYPDSPLIPEVAKRIAELNDWFAQKDMEIGMHYLRRKAYDSAIIYLRDVTRNYPATPTARSAYLRLIDAYRAIRYREEIAEVCGEMRKAYEADAEVRAACSSVPAEVATPATAAPVPGTR
jgi:outer membrane assembly lipoprotein YfiO